MLQANFNPIIVLFLTIEKETSLTVIFDNFNPIIVLFLTPYRINKKNIFFFEFQSYYSLISNSKSFQSIRIILISILL